jgi:hypothetical protein
MNATPAVDEVVVGTVFRSLNHTPPATTLTAGRSPLAARPDGCASQNRAIPNETPAEVVGTTAGVGG